MPQCSGGSCQQGRARCTTPEACGALLPEPPRMFEPTYEIKGPFPESTQLRWTDYLVLAFVLAFIFFALLRHYGVV